MSAAAPPSSDEAAAATGGLTDLSQVPEDQRDEEWVKQYYQKGVPQLTWRAVITGGLLGMLMSLANLYTTLHVGWSFGVAITSGVLAFAIWGVLGRIPGLSQMTLLENNCMQSAASAAGYATGGTLATAVGAMLLIGGDEDRLGWLPVGAWVFLTGCLGVFLAIPMKRQMINQEQLPFPSGIAAAATLRSLYAKGRESVLAARALIGAMVVGAILAFVRDKLAWIPGLVPFTFRFFRVRDTDFSGDMLMGVGFEPSLLLIAAGMIVGIRVCTWMFVGSLLNVTALMPYALSQPDWHEDGKTFFGHVETVSLGTTFPAGNAEVDGDAIGEVAAQLNAISSSGAIELHAFANAAEPEAERLARSRASAVRAALEAHGVSSDRITIAEPSVISARDGSRRVLYYAGSRPVTLAVRVTRWSLWFGTAMLVASGLTAFALGWRTILRAFQKLRQARSGKKEESAIDALEVPTSWFVYGMIPITIGLVALCWLSLQINPILGVVSVALSFFISLVACRATGETDTTPIGPLGKITQFIYAVLAPANTTVNLMTAGITSGAAGASADLLTDLKSGYLLGANPRQQFIAQASGVIFGTLAVVPAWYLMVPDRATLDAINSPATSMWYAVAMALSRGVESIPDSARMAIAVGAVLGIVIALAEGLAPKNLKKWIPSSMGLGLAFVVNFQNSFSFFIGALITLVWTYAHKQSAERYVVPAASGAIAGESITGAGIAIWDTVAGLLGAA